MMYKKKKILDEYQEQKKLQIEHRALLLVNYCLLASMILQKFMEIQGVNVLSNIAGEYYIFMGLNIYLSIAYLKNGIWGEKSQPNLKSIIISSLAGSVLIGIFALIWKLVMGSAMESSFAFALYISVFTFILLFIALYLMLVLTKMRIAKIESNCDKDLNQ